jgi:ribosome biogenesis protein NSA1
LLLLFSALLLWTGQQVWVANGTGHMQLWVLQTNKLMDALKGAGGSVRTLAQYPGSEPWLASVGLDRFLRIHDTTTRAAKARVYLKQQLTSVVWLPVLQPPAAAAGAAAAAAAEDAADVAADAAQKSGSKKKKKNKSRDSKQQSSADGAGEGDAAEAQQSKKRLKRAG